MTARLGIPPDYIPVQTQSIDRSLSSVYGWSAFLGISWTWCIGMFLPVLLIRDYGFWAWVIFAIPNVAGAAAMGTVLAAPGTSARMIQPHRGAGIVFSIVTISFHAFFISWVVRGLIGPIAIVITAVAAVVFYIVGMRGRRDLAVAAVIFILSLVAFAWFATGNSPPALVSSHPVLGVDLLALAAVCVLGFTFCPYLDLTFHRARQSTAPVAGISSFAIGFGVMFFLMICFTLWYARVMVPGTWGQMNRAVAWLLATHMMLQAAYTIAVHFREVSRQWDRIDSQVKGGTFIGLLLGAMPVTLMAVMPSVNLVDPRELIYRLFMSFYALVFPAYVWICMTPIPKVQGASMTRVQVTAFVFAIAIASPFYWMGFIDRQMKWVLLGVAVIVMCRIVVRIVPRTAISFTAHPADDPGV